MKKSTTALFALMLVSAAAFAQNTVGLLQHVDSLAYPGFNLIYPHNQSTTYLLDNCGRIVHTWADTSNMRPGNSVYLRDNGNLLRCSRPAFFSLDPIWAGGGGAFVQELDWNGNLIWEWEWNDSTGRLHHDIAPMPNGNVLAIAWVKKTLSEAIDAGRDPNFIPEGEIWPDAVLELEPNGQGGANVVWEWHSWDHLIQDYDSTKANYGAVGDHPELIDMNFGDDAADWHHMNGIHYNPTLDHIVLSVPTYNEIWIIDHSTTTAEAASHAGGNAGKGGDLIYRWGNPMAYRQGDSTDTQLFFQHDVHWIDRNLPSGSPDYGKLMIYNNQVSPTQSDLVILAPQWDSLGQSYAMSGNTYAPATFDWVYTTPNPADMASSGLSSGQRLPNGNTLIMVGRAGRAFEITPSEQIVWNYKVPLMNGLPVSQGDSIGPNFNLTFRVQRYSMDFPGFAGRSFVPLGYIETNPDTTAPCNVVLAAAEPASPVVSIYPNPTTGRVTLSRGSAAPAQLELFDLRGQRLRSLHVRGKSVEISLEGLEAGMYLIQLDRRAAGRVVLTR